MRAQRWRVDAINVTYERIGTLDEIKSLARDNGWCDVDINRRHKDEKDEIDPFYEHTCVFSCFFTQLNEVWRLSIIAFGRACLTSSTKRVLNREYFRKVLIDYLEDYNGGLEYIDFNLSDQLPYFVTNDCYRKLRQCNGSEESSDNVIPLDWAEDNQKYPGFRYVQLAEFMNRCGYSSSFASAIVQLSTQHGGLPRDKVVELILIAMKGCGSRNFCYVLTVLWKNIQKQELLDSCLQHLYWATCQKNGLTVNGGNNPRMRGGKDTMEGVIPQEAINGERDQNLALFPFLSEEERSEYEGYSNEQVKLVKHLIEYIENEPDRMKDMDWIIKGLSQFPNYGLQRSRSFFMLLVMTGVASSKAARELSSLAPINWTGRYGKELVHKDIKSDKEFFDLCSDLFYAFQWDQQTVENSLCAIYRDLQRKDEFYHGQILFLVLADRERQHNVHVFQKPFGSTRWVPVTPCYVADST
jgi:hypothetical protein